MIAISKLKFRYPNQASLQWPDFSSDQYESNALVIIGPSGSGKTTLLHLIAGILKAEEGEIQLLGKNLQEMSTKERDAFRGKNVGLLFQETHYWSSLNIMDNLAMAVNLAGASTTSNQILDQLERLGISHLAKKKPQHCSVGERQRFGVAMATIHQPALVLADEPTSALDDANCNKVLDLLEKEVVARGAFLLVITHDMRVKDRFEQVIHLKSEGHFNETV